MFLKLSGPMPRLVGFNLEADALKSNRNVFFAFRFLDRGSLLAIIGEHLPPYTQKPSNPIGSRLGCSDVPALS